MDKYIELLSKLGGTNSSNEKQDILKQYPECKEQLYYALNSFRMYGVTSKNIDVVFDGSKGLEWADCKELLDKLYNRELTGNAAIEAITELLNGTLKGEQAAFFTFLNKDLGIGVGEALVNKVWKDLIPIFDVQLCNKWEDLEKLPFKNTCWSRKLDGVRVLAIKTDTWKFCSRKGKEFTSLNVLEKELNEKFKTLNNAVFDGELCIIDENGKENFTEAVSQIKRKDYTIENPKFVIFDHFSLDDFSKKSSNLTFENRLKRMQVINEGIYAKHFRFLEQHSAKTPQELQEAADLASKEGWEGLILRNLDAPYEGKRTKNLLKVKKFYDSEFTITGTFEGQGNFAGTLGGLSIEGEFEGKKIRSDVGSGFSEGQREEFWAKREALIGEIVTIKFFEVSQAKNAEVGIYSLRFPTFKVIHGKVRSI